MELNFAGNEAVATAIAQGLVRFDVAAEYDIARRVTQFVMFAEVWENTEGFARRYAPYKSFSLRPTGEWIEYPQGTLAESFKEPIESSSVFGFAKVWKEKAELEALRNKYIDDTSKLIEQLVKAAS